MKYILGIDIGTQSVKAGLVNAGNMRVERVASREYQGKSLQEPEELWRGTVGAVRELAEAAGGENIKGIGFSGQMHGTVLYDAAGEIIGPVINWQDERGNRPLEKFGGKTAVEKMKELIGEDDFGDLGIDVMASGFFGVTLFHIKETEPELFSKIAHALLPTDFIRGKMLGGGEFATDPTNAFGTGIFNTRENRWHWRVIEKLGLPAKILPEVRPTEEKAGGVGKEAAALTGLKEGTPVVHGGGDNQMAVIGGGVHSPDSPILINIGTSGQVCAVVREYVKVPGVDTRSFIHGNFLLAGAGLTGGMAFTWFRNSLLADLGDMGIEYGGRAGLFALLDRLAENLPPGCGGLKFAPFLRGSRRAPDLRAAFTGVSLDNFSLGHRARAVLEGVVAELLGFYKNFPAMNPDRIIGAGNGLVKSDLWRRITARAFGLPLYVTDFENAVYGAALVAAEGLGIASIADGKFDYVHVCEPEE